MAVLTATSNPQTIAAAGVTIQSAQAGDGVSTDTADRKGLTGPAALVVTSTVGSTPTTTMTIQGSADGTNWFAIPYALVATPQTFVVTAITITTAVTVTYLLQTGQPWRYLRTSKATTTNVSLTSVVYFFRS